MRPAWPMTPDLPAIAPRRLHPAYLVISLGRTLRALLPLIAVAIWRAPLWSIALAAGLVLLRSSAEWWMRRYSVTAGTLYVSSGILKRSTDTIGVQRITSVDAQRGVVQRLFRVWGVKIRTPGNDHRSSVSLACLSTQALEQLRAALTRSTAGAAVALPRTDGESGCSDPQESRPGPEPQVLAVLDTRTLLVAAFTGTSIPLMVAGAGAAFGRARDLLPDRTFDRLAREVFVGGPSTALLVIAGLLLAALAGVTLTALRLARFTLIRDGDRLRTSRGLIAQRTGTIPVDRVQAIRMVEGWWRRRFGYCALEVEVAGLSTSNDTERMLFPLLRTSSAAALVGGALPELGWRPAPLRALPGSARRRYLTLPILLAIVPTVGLALLPGWWGCLALVALPTAALIGSGQAADAGWQLDDATVVVRWRRVLARHTVIAGRHRVQVTEVTRTVFQRQAGLSGVRLLLSSRRRARLRHLREPDADMLLHSVGRGRSGGPTTGEDAPASYRPRTVVGDGRQP